MINSFPQELLQKKCHKIVCEALGEKYIKLSVEDFTLSESAEHDTTAVVCMLVFSNNWGNLQIEGSGVGMVDALFNSMLAVFCKDFFSLRQVQFEDFSMEVKFSSFKVRPTDAPVEIKVALINQRKKRIYFSSQSRSITTAIINTITKTFEYLINAEMAFRQLRCDIAEAQKRNRTDLVRKYTSDMADLVNIVSYEDVF